MKRLLLFSVILLAVSIACRALIPTPVPTITPEPTLTSTPTPIPTPTETPLPPTPVPITCADDTCLQACLNRIKVVLEIQPFAPVPENNTDDPSRINLVRYKVDGDQITQLGELSVPSEYASYQQDHEAQLRIWNYFIAILPADQRKRITEFLVFTDGKGNAEAWVRPSPTDPGHWILGVDILDSRNPVAMTETLLHEFGHLLTLNTDQMTLSRDYYFSGKQGTSMCPQYGNENGCTNENSYLNQFYQKFWKKIYPEWFKNVFQPVKGGLDWELVNGFYLRYPDQFNTVYSAASPEEDIAEAFSAFVLGPKPGGNTIADQKVQFFYGFPELTRLRTYVIQGICSYVQ